MRIVQVEMGPSKKFYQAIKLSTAKSKMFEETATTLVHSI